MKEVEFDNAFPVTAFDFFAGAGGASLGLHKAGYNMLAALNHSPIAIKTHQANFASAQHFLCDIRVQSEWKLPKADVMWASPDCTHHSIAKGGQSRDAKERALAEELPRFAYALDVNCIMIENVKEFLDWGPVIPVLDKEGNHVHKYNKSRKEWEPQFKADPARKKEFYLQWLAALKGMGFVNYEFRLLNSADFGAPQSRTRYFGIFTRAGIPISWPKPTHDKQGRGGLAKWRGVREVLDLADRGRSIFTEWDKGPGRKAGDVPAEKTLYRILAGVRKHVIAAHGITPWLDKRSSNHPSGKPNSGSSIKNPSPTVATCYLPDLVTPAFLHNPAWFGASSSTEQPSPVIVASQDKVPLSVVQPQFMMHNYGGVDRGRALCNPAATITTTGGGQYLCTPRFLCLAYGGDPRYQSKPLEDPAGTVTTSDHHQLITAQGQFLTHNYGGGGQSSELAQPSPTQLTRDKSNLVSPQFLTNYYSGGGQLSSLCDPCATLTTNPHGRLVTPMFLAQYNGGADNSRCLALTNPCNTVTTENRFGLVSFMTQSNGVSEGASPAAKTWSVEGAGRTVTASPNQSIVSALYQNNGTRDNADAAQHTRSLDQPSPTVTTNGGNLFLSTYYGHGGNTNLCQPCPTITTKDRVALIAPHNFLTNHQYENGAWSIDEPTRAVVASRRHQYLATVLEGCPHLHPQPGDSEAMRELKQVCAEHGIADIFMRMLKVSELKLIMGFPEDYVLHGGVTKKKEMLGNAVVSAVSEAIGRTMLPALRVARATKRKPLKEVVVERWEQGELFQ